MARTGRLTLSSARTSQAGLLVLALLVGTGAGLGAVVFRAMISGLTHVFTGYADYSLLGHAANPHLPWLGRWFVVGAPVVAGLLYGPLVYRFAREARGHGVPEQRIVGVAGEHVGKPADHGAEHHRAKTGPGADQHS